MSGIVIILSTIFPSPLIAGIVEQPLFRNQSAIQNPQSKIEMSLLSTHHLSHAYGENDLIVDVSLRIEAGERIGMVGPNGVGKTTLLLILSGLLKPDEGEIARQADLTLGYLRQEAVLTFAGQENTVYQEMLSVFAHLAEQEKRLQELEAAMSGGELGEAVLEEYGRLQHAYEADGGTNTTSTSSGCCWAWASTKRAGRPR